MKGLTNEEAKKLIGIDSKSSPGPELPTPVPVDDEKIRKRG